MEQASQREKKQSSSLVISHGLEIRLNTSLQKNEERLKQISDQKETEETIESWKNEIQKDARGHRVVKKRKLSTTEIALLLQEKLQSGDNLSFVNSLFFPSAVNMSKLLPLEFDRREQKQELERTCPNISKNELKLAHTSLSNDVWKPILEEEIEKIFIEKVVISSQIGKIADTSKRKHGVRLKLASVKKKESFLIEEYLKVTSRLNDKQLCEELQTGQFSWRNSVSESTAIERRIMVEIFLKKKHLLEERFILKNEMTSTLAFFQNKIALLQYELKTETEQLSKDDAIDLSLNVLERKGSMMLKKESLQWYRGELEKGIKTFAPVLDPTSLPLFLDEEVEGEDEKDDDNDEQNNFDDEWEDDDQSNDDESNDDESEEKETTESQQI